MKKNSDKKLRRFLSFALILAMVLFNTAAVFAAEESPEEAGHENSSVTEVSVQNEPEPQVSSPAAEPVAEDTSQPAPEQDAQPAEEAAAEPEEASEETAAADQPADEDITITEEVSDGAASAPSSAEKKSASAAQSASKGSVENTISIGGTSFSSGDDESSNWKDGSGWKNVAGQYIAMVDYDGSKAELSADGGVVTLAVAGINRIGALKGDCSYQITGSGIVLIDSIDIAEGRSVTLAPNTALYEEGSAAVFVKQTDETYLLINGDITGILDEEYILDLEGVNLVVPKGSNLLLNAMCVRTETYVPEGSEEPATDVTCYTTDMHWSLANPSHANGRVKTEDYGSRLIIGKDSTLTIDKDASVHLNKINKPYIGEYPVVVAELIVQGALNVAGILEGGCVDIQNGGQLSGTGTVKSSEVALDPSGKLDISLEDSVLTVYSNADGSTRSISPTVKDSIIYLRGTNIDLPDLKVSGSSILSTDTSSYPLNKIGNITFSPGGNLGIAVNKYDRNLDVGYFHEEELLNERDGLNDSYLEIYGNIIGGTVSVLAGCVNYIGNQSKVPIAVPEGYGSRVFVKGNGITSAIQPLNMTQEEASARAELDKIPIVLCAINDEWEPEKGLYRVWNCLGGKFYLNPVSRKQVTYPELLNLCGLLNEDGYIMTNTNVAVELIYSDLSRRFMKAAMWYPASAVAEAAENEEFQWSPISLDDVILIRVVQYVATGGFGGSSATHVSTSFTGSGVIGGPGSGSMRVGASKVVYSNGTPIPEDPEPEDNDNGDNNSNNNKDTSVNTNVSSKDAGKKTVKKTAVKSAAFVANIDGLAATVSLLESAEEDPGKADPKMPQIWQLDVTRAGAPVTDLAGNAIKLAFRFTVPEAWGNPAEIDSGSLYAVFADENEELTAYSAQYDPETGEISFEAEQTGEFVIVQFVYEDELFTEDFYSELAELEEIQAFLAALNVSRE